MRKPKRVELEVNDWVIENHDTTCSLNPWLVFKVDENDRQCISTVEFGLKRDAIKYAESH